MAVDVPTQLAIANTRIAFYWPRIWLLQKYVWSNFGFYVQGLRSHTTVPENGNLEVPDFPNLTTEDQPFGWGPFLGYFPPSMMTALSVTPYLYPGHQPGFMCKFEMRLNGDLYEKRIAYGPDSDSETFDWIKIKENE